MSSGHCGNCGAMSTIWLPTCVFCGGSLTGSDSQRPRSQPVINVALMEMPAVGAPTRKCTSRVYREKPKSEGMFHSFLAFCARLIPRLNFSRR